MNVCDCLWFFTFADIGKGDDVRPDCGEMERNQHSRGIDASAEACREKAASQGLQALAHK